MMMELLPYSLSALVAFSGVLVGVFLAKTAKEEMPTGRKYFPLLQKVLLISIVAVMLNYFNAHIIVKIVAYAALLFVITRKTMLNFYPLLAVAFFALGQSEQGLLAISLLVFLYGFPTGSLYVINNKKMNWIKSLGKAGLRYTVFPVLAVILQALSALF